MLAMELYFQCGGNTPRQQEESLSVKI